VIELLEIFAVGLISGVASGAFGVGGGVITVPAMVLLLSLGQQTAQGTSLLAIVPTALSGALSHHRLGALRQRIIVLVGIAGMTASLLGSYLALHLEVLTLRRIFAVWLVAVAARMLLLRGPLEMPS
jgi:uncharacterized membrane protein YfcA